MYIFLCLCYVKIILNEIKRPELVPNLETLIEVSGGDSVSEKVNGSEGNINKKTSKRTMVAKAFFLDVLSDYIKLVLRERKHKLRWILILYLLIAIVSGLWPYHNGSVLEFANFWLKLMTSFCRLHHCKFQIHGHENRRL